MYNVAYSTMYAKAAFCLIEAGCILRTFHRIDHGKMKPSVHCIATKYRVVMVSVRTYHVTIVI